MEGKEEVVGRGIVGKEISGQGTDGGEVEVKKRKDLAVKEAQLLFGPPFAEDPEGEVVEEGIGEGDDTLSGNDGSSEEGMDGMDL